MWESDATARAAVEQSVASSTADLGSASALTGMAVSIEAIANGPRSMYGVTAGGAYAGDATISTGRFCHLGADGSYSQTLMALTRDANIREKSEGTWTVDDDGLVLSNGGRYSLLGYGSQPGVGRFLVLGNYSDTEARLKFTNPRGILQAQWLRAE